MELPEAVREEIASLEKKIGLLRKLAPPYLATCEAMEVAGFNNYLEEAGVIGDTGTPYVNAHVCADSFQQVGTFGKTLHKHGFHLLRQYDMGPLKIINYTGPVTLYVSFGRHSSCKYVKVGEKMEPVYKLKCEDKPA